MEYHLDRRLVLVTEPEHKGLYSWAINEVGADGRVVDRDQIPWPWNLTFTATEIVLSDRLTVREGWSGDEQRLGQGPEITATRLIRAALRPGDRWSDANRSGRTTYRMFGTDRTVESFVLDVLPLPSEDEAEVCQAWGMVSYTAEHDFRNVTEPDHVSFTLMVKPSTFDLYARRIAEGTADEVTLSVGKVAGFYADWSPSVSTRDVRILARGGEQAIELPPGVDFEAPRLGSVGEASLHIDARRSSSTIAAAKDDSDEPPAAPLVRAAGSPSGGGSDPQTIKILQALHRLGRAVVALLIVLILVALFR